jgi:hypothetical protein
MVNGSMLSDFGKFPIGKSEYAMLRIPCSSNHRTPNPDPMPRGFHYVSWSHTTTSLIHSCDRGSRDREFDCRESFTLETPECRNPDDTCQHHANTVGPVVIRDLAGPPWSHMPRHFGISRTANPRCKFSLLLKTPNSDVPISGI